MEALFIYVFGLMVMFVFLGVRNKFMEPESDIGSVMLTIFWPICAVAVPVVYTCKGCYLLGGYIYNLYIKFKE